MLTQIVCANAHDLSSVQSGTTVVGVAAGVGCTALEVEDCRVQAVAAAQTNGIGLAAVPCFFSV